MEFHPALFAWTAVGLSTFLFLAVLLKVRLSADDRSFLFLILCNLAWDAGYILSWPFEDPAAPSYRLMFGAACLLPGAFVDFLVRSTGHAGRRIVWILYGAGILFLAASFIAEIGYTWKISLIGFVVASTALALFIIARAARDPHPAIRSRAKYMLMAVLAASLGGIADMIQGLAGHLPLTGALGSALALAIIAVATARIEGVAIHPLSLDLVVVGALGIAYFGIVAFLHSFITQAWAVAVTTVVVIITVRPGAEALRLFIKQVLLGIKIREADVVRRARETILASRSEPELENLFCSFLNQTFGLDRSSFSVAKFALSPAETEILKIGPLTLGAAGSLPEGNLRDEFRSGEIGAALGFFRDGQFAGLLKLSPKQNGRRFFPEELGLIETLGEELTFAHENLRLTRRERLARLGEAIASVSHEIKNPLTTLIPSVEILRAGNKSPELKEVGDLVAAELRRLRSLVNQYLEFARPYEPARQAFDLAALVREIAKTFDRVAVESNGAVPVNADESGIRQVLLNLLQNARDAGADKPVVVSVNLSGGTPVIRVRDSGPGIDKNIAARLFEPFVTTKSRGTGLGLAICKQIIDAHGGEIKLFSDDKGAVAEIRLAREEP